MSASAIPAVPAFSVQPAPGRARRARGFSLVEVALAVTIVAVVLLAAIGLVVPAQRAIEEVLTTDQATRLRGELEKELSVVRPGESYASGFDKAYQIVRDGGDRKGLLAAFFYRAQKPTGAAGSGATSSDGRLKPFTESVSDKRAGADYLIQAAIMPLEAFEKQTDFIEALEGRPFMIRLSYLKGLLPPESDAAFGSGASAAFPEAVIPATADFFVIEDLDNPTGPIERILDGTTRPVLSLNIGFNR
jgi:prepilin-type N-terminal cleavage/methylation domain-containing protein